MTPTSKHRAFFPKLSFKIFFQHPNTLFHVSGSWLVTETLLDVSHFENMFLSSSKLCSGYDSSWSVQVSHSFLQLPFPAFAPGSRAVHKHEELSMSPGPCWEEGAGAGLVAGNQGCSPCYRWGGGGKYMCGVPGAAHTAYSPQGLRNLTALL